MESGNPIAISALDRSFQPIFGNLTKAAGCSNMTDALQCLRALPFADLNAVVNTTQFSGAWSPQIDHDLVARYSNDQVAEGAFVKVPIIVGANSDEGTSFAPKGLNSSELFKQFLICRSCFSHLIVELPNINSWHLAEECHYSLANLGCISSAVIRERPREPRPIRLRTSCIPVRHAISPHYNILHRSDFYC
jgi:hypothetical protein